MYQVDPAAQVGKVEGVLQGGVAAPHHRSLLAAEKSSVAGGTVRNALSGKLSLAGTAQLAAPGPVGNDDRIGGVLTTGGGDVLGGLPQLHGGHLLQQHFGTGLGRLVVKGHGQLGAADPPHTGVVFNLGGVYHLAAVNALFQHRHTKAGTAGVQGGAQTGGACADHGNIVMLHSNKLLSKRDTNSVSV